MRFLPTPAHSNAAARRRALVILLVAIGALAAGSMVLTSGDSTPWPHDKHGCLHVLAELSIVVGMPLFFSSPLLGPVAELWAALGGMGLVMGGLFAAYKPLSGQDHILGTDNTILYLALIEAVVGVVLVRLIVRRRRRLTGASSRP